MAMSSKAPLLEQLPSQNAHTTRKRHKENYLKLASKEQGKGFLTKLVKNAKEAVFDFLVHSLYRPQGNPNLNFQGNFSPVQEIGSWIAVEVVDGVVPDDFPAGTYIRNGPNPYLRADNLQSPFGKSEHHWFEGDGMLHATRFERGGRLVLYQNKFVNSLAHDIERQTKKISFLPALEGDIPAIKMNLLINMLRHGKANRVTCNTQIFQHAGRIYAVAEGDTPYEINITDLNTIGTLDFDGKWDVPFTAHPRVDVHTGELVIFGVSTQKPFLQMGIVSKYGKLVHKTDLGLERTSFVHELPITKHYNLVLDFPLTIDVNRITKGTARLIEFERDSYSRIGVMPRHGDSTSIRWFDVSPGHSFHTVNAFEDGDEVVLYATFARWPFVAPAHNMDKLEWFARAITPTDPNKAEDPLIDGAITPMLREWRFNLLTGTVVERDLTDLDTCGVEMPTINTKYTGTRNQYAYAQVVDFEASRASGMPKYGKMVKIQLPKSDQDEIKMEYHTLGANRYGSEPVFVPRPNSTAEDDGWIITYVHDELTNMSEVHIVDAQMFQEKAITRIQLPQRVPYGFHSGYFLE